MKVIVKVKDRKFVFEFKGHLSQAPEQLKLDPIGVYEKNNAEIPKGSHIELEIVSLPNECEKVLKGLHIYNAGEKRFVYYTGCIPTDIEAREIVRLWSLGSIYTTLVGNDFTPFFYSKDNNLPLFESFLKEEYDIVCLWCNYLKKKNP